LALLVDFGAAKGVIGFGLAQNGAVSRCANTGAYGLGSLASWSVDQLAAGHGTHLYVQINAIQQRAT
jgi:hypothetical protein